MWADDKFLIWKGKSLTQSVANLSGAIHRALQFPVASGHLFEKLMAQVESKRCLWVEIDVVEYASDPLNMLQVEFLLLQKEKSNPNCLNVSFDPHIPKWVPLNAVEGYNKWKASLT